MTQRPTFKYFCSVWLCLSTLFSSAPTWAKTLAWPTGIQVGADALRPFQEQYNGQKGTQYELNATTDFARWILEGDWGWGTIRWEGHNKKTATQSSYASDGQYFRIGLNYNLLHDTPEKNMAFLGFRYARSFFNDHLASKVCYDSNGLIKDEYEPINSKHSNVTAHWLEAVAGVKVKVWKLLYIGGTIRYKFGLRLHRTAAHRPYDVPGWGLNRDTGAFGCNLYLALRIPFVRNIAPNSSRGE